MLPIGHPSQLQRQTQTQRKGVKNDTPRKWHPEKSGCSRTYIRQKIFQDKKS